MAWSESNLKNQDQEHFCFVFATHPQLSGKDVRRTRRFAVLHDGKLHSSNLHLGSWSRAEGWKSNNLPSISKSISAPLKIPKSIQASHSDLATYAEGIIHGDPFERIVGLDQTCQACYAVDLDPVLRYVTSLKATAQAGRKEWGILYLMDCFAMIVNALELWLLIRWGIRKSSCWVGICLNIDTSQISCDNRVVNILLSSYSDWRAQRYLSALRLNLIMFRDSTISKIWNLYLCHFFNHSI